MIAPVTAINPLEISSILAPFASCGGTDADVGIPIVAVEVCDTEVASPEVGDAIDAD